MLHKALYLDHLYYMYMSMVCASMSVSDVASFVIKIYTLNMRSVLNIFLIEIKQSIFLNIDKTNIVRNIVHLRPIDNSYTDVTQGTIFGPPLLYVYINAMCKYISF